MKKNVLRNYFPIILGCAILIAITVSALSYSSGISGQTQNGCYCHGSSGSATTVSLTSQSGGFVVNQGSSANFTVTVSNGSQVAAGVNIAVKTTQTGETNVGSLTAGSGLQTMNGELTHSSPKSLVGGNAEFNFSWTAPNTPGIYYLRAVGNAVNSADGSSGDVWNRITTQAITVPGIELTSLNGGQSLCPGGQSNITWTAVGITNIKIELSSNGGSSFETVLINSTNASAGSWSWNIPSQLTPGNQYKVRISSVADANLNDVSSNNFTIGEPAQISTHPVSQQKCTGQSVSFSVTATGAELTYQWRKNGSNISGATQSTYNISNLLMSHAGNYDVIVDGSCGNAVTSNQAVLSLNESPSISVHPASQTKCPGESVTFNVTASGTEITYQWMKNGTNISGATQNSLSIDNLASTNAGAYTVQISGVCTPAITSNIANLVVNSPVEITSISDDITKCGGETLQLTVQSNGSNLTYQWMKDGANLQGQTTESLIIENVKKTDEGIYSVKVNGDCQSSETSSPVNVSISEKPVITQQPSDANTSVGDEVIFKVSTNNTASTYQWRKNSVNIAQAKDSILKIASVSLSDSGSYDCVATNGCGNITSNSVLLFVQPRKAGAAIKLAQNTIDFGISNIGTSKSKVFDAFLENTGDEILKIENIEITGNGSADFRLIKPVIPIDVLVGEKINFELEFIPSKKGAITANIEISSNSVNNPGISLSGFGGILNVQLSVVLLDFEEITFGETEQKEIIIENMGNYVVNITKTEITGANPSDFSIQSGTNPDSIKPGESITINVVYNPENPGDSKANLEISTDIDSVFVISLQGSSKIVSVEDNTYSILNSISPNPTFSELKITLNIETADFYELSIFDNIGKLVKVLQNDFLYKGENNIHWDLLDSQGSNCPSGKYNLIVKREGIVNAFRFIINK